MVYNMHKMEELISEKDIAAKVSEIAALISHDFKGQDLTVVSVLKGSFIFTADLVRSIDIPLEVAFLAASSYGASTESSGELNIRYDIDIPIENKIISNAVETAQKRVEGRNFSIRKNVLKYDDVMNAQREIIYKQRRQVLDGENINQNILNMIKSLAEELVLQQHRSKACQHHYRRLQRKPLDRDQLEWLLQVRPG